MPTGPKGQKKRRPSDVVGNAVHVNRAAQSIDLIVINKGAVSYECVWGQPTTDGPWLCAFALNVCDWKNLGEPRIYQRDCVGFYVQPEKPVTATREIGPPPKP